MKFIVVAGFLLWLSAYSHAMTAEEAKIVKDSVLELCRGGTLEGKDSAVQIEGQGQITTVRFNKLAEAGFSGEAEFSQKEWAGIRPLLADSQDSSAYMTCVRELTPIFVSKLSPDDPGPLNIIGKWVYEDGYHYWVVRPGRTGQFTIELYTLESRQVGQGTATVEANIVNFSLTAGNHYVGDTLFVMPAEINGRLEYSNNTLSGSTDAYDLEYLEDPASIPTLTLHRAP